MKISPRHPFRYLGLLVALLSITATVARSQITFSVDTFTTDELTITLEASTLSGTPSGSGLGYLTILGMVGDNFGSTYLAPNSWITAGADISASETAPGSLGAVAFNPSSSAAQPSTFAGPSVYISGDSPNFVTGASIASPYQVTFAAAGRFDTSVITGFRLYWGTVAEFSSGNNFLQSTTSLTAVPEPSQATALLAVIAGTAVFLRRSRRSKPLA